MTDAGRDFQLIYSDYYPKIVGYLRRLVGEAEAEDVAQEAFVKASKALDGFRGDSSLSTWLYRIATNAAMDHLRKSASRRIANVPDGFPEDDEPGESAIPDDGKPVLDTLLIWKNMNECIRGIVDSLPVSRARMQLSSRTSEDASRSAARSAWILPKKQVFPWGN